MRAHLELELRFTGKDAEAARLQYYDAAQALVGFERVISLTNHLLLNGEIITQSPSAKGFQTFLLPPEEGSWKAGIGIFFGTLLTVGVASKDSALGYLAVSALDYVLQQSLGFEVDFEENLWRQILESKEANLIPSTPNEARFDSLLEKVESGLLACHRPIVFSESAQNAQVEYRLPSRQGALDGFFDAETYEYISKDITSEDVEDFSGIISSYNTNTFKGRIYIESMHRTIPFELSPTAQSLRSRRAIAGSLYENTSPGSSFRERVTLRGFRNESVSGRIKRIYVTEVNPKTQLRN